MTIVQNLESGITHDWRCGYTEHSDFTASHWLVDQPTLPGFDTRKCTQCFAPTFPHGGAVQR